MWGLVLDKNNRITSAINCNPIPPNLPVIDELPEGELINWIYNNGKLIYSEDEARKREKAAYAIKQEVSELKTKLNESDYIMAHAVEDLLAATSIIDILKVLKEYSTTYKETITKRKTWRERIKELEN